MSSMASVQSCASLSTMQSNLFKTVTPALGLSESSNWNFLRYASWLIFIWPDSTSVHRFWTCRENVVAHSLQSSQSAACYKGLQPAAGMNTRGGCAPWPEMTNRFCHCETESQTQSARFLSFYLSHWHGPWHRQVFDPFHAWVSPLFDPYCSSL